MKRLRMVSSICLALLASASSILAQTNYTCTFSANVEFDSVQVKNTVSGISKILYSPDNIITLQQNAKQETAIAIVNNSAFMQQITNDKVVVNVEKASQLNLVLYSTDGKVVARYANNVSTGEYAFQVGAKAGVYVLVATANNQFASVKLSLTENAQASISEVSTNESVVFLKSAEDIITFNEGEKFEFTGYYQKQTDVKSATITKDEEIVFAFEKEPVKIENGAIQAVFSVSNSKQVYFSMGNLQYKASTKTWRFAEHQYDMIGYDNANISSSYSGYIDLFGWGTSGFNGKNPYMTSTDYSDYGVVGDADADIAGTNYDWGVYNKISNGGNQAGMWRTLTYEEWDYVMYERSDASSLYGVACVNGVNGMVLLPDNWVQPSGLYFKSGVANDCGSDYYKTVNNYNMSEWSKMEANGAVFLPVAGSREDLDVYVGSATCYQSSSASGNEYAICLYFDSDETSMSESGRECGHLVRLVQDFGENTEQEPVKIENGAIQAAFSVSNSKQVYFSMGNLQYKASNGEWRFAEHQYDMVGNDNANISADYDGYIDLFGWGTSGWNSEANAYQPYSTIRGPSDYYPGGSYSNNLTGSYAKADWGVYNKISNGGNEAGMWRTLTYEEWQYVMFERSNASSLYGVACVNGVNGLVLLPDNWVQPSELYFKSGVANDYGSDYYKTVNNYNMSEWSKMEANGAVFLPAVGSRLGSGVSNVGSFGNYWSSSANDSDNAYNLTFSSGRVDKSRSIRYAGRAVRLVRGL